MKSKLDSVKRAFNYEQGQYICHVYAKISDDERESLEEIIREVEQVQNEPSCLQAMKDWRTICDLNSDDELGLHLTLLRGHRAIHYHQIKYLVDSVKTLCNQLEPFKVCLDELKIFHNYERTKQFLCLAGRSSQHSTDSTRLHDLKQLLRQKVDEFAIKLSDEDETTDTLSHCSLMYRKLNANDELLENDPALNDFNRHFSESHVEIPICIIQVNTIHLKIGHLIYDIELNYN